jgi:hypothetical protein
MLLLLIFNLIISVTLVEINPTIALAQIMTSNASSNNNTDYGDLSAESTDIAEANKTDLIRSATNGSIRSSGGLSAESIEIAESNKTDSVADATIDNGADSGGLSARSVNITK